MTQLKNNWKTLTEAVVKAVAEYLGVKYTPVSLDGYYIVKSGDSLWNISKKYGISVDELKAENNLKSNTLSIGQNYYYQLIRLIIFILLKKEIVFIK